MSAVIFVTGFNCGLAVAVAMARFKVRRQEWHQEGRQS